MVDRSKNTKKFIVNNREFDHYTKISGNKDIKFHNKVDK
ncbi:MAG: hypothetical protein CM15mP98_04660 [Paracoccaceae bacterium]|nr:MAG: hypothetical protein CM15mP98_04660 [Paracoccaceae bacterium]